MKSDSLTEIGCRLSDCLFYEAEAQNAGKILCSHKDAPRYIFSDPPCPLYRLDWQKKLAKAPKVAPPNRMRMR